MYCRLLFIHVPSSHHHHDHHADKVYLGVRLCAAGYENMWEAKVYDDSPSVLMIEVSVLSSRKCNLQGNWKLQQFQNNGDLLLILYIAAHVQISTQSRHPSGNQPECLGLCTASEVINKSHEGWVSLTGVAAWSHVLCLHEVRMGWYRVEIQSLLNPHQWSRYTKLWLCHRMAGPPHRYHRALWAC